MIERDRILAIHGPVSWVRYDHENKQWARPYLDGHPICGDGIQYWYQRRVDPYDLVDLTDTQIATIREAWPQEAGLNVFPGLDGLDPRPWDEQFDDTVIDDDLFRRWTAAELLAQPDDFQWLITGMLAAPTYGMVAGEMKTLKSHLQSFLTVGLAAGVPIFDRFKPPNSAPVVCYVGEGGQIPYTRRLRRIAAAMGVGLGDLPLHSAFDVAPITSSVFQESLQRDLKEIEPGLVSIDPYYTYHGAQVKAADLHQEASVLNALSGPCAHANASVLVVNHFNQSGAGTNLKRITMAGSGEWADSWLLLDHREDPDVENGLFRLHLEIGSRQWGGTSWDLDLDIGRFDEDTGTHDGSISWDLRRAKQASQNETPETSSKVQIARHAIVEVVGDKPWQLTKTEIFERVGGNRAAFNLAINGLVDDGLIQHDKVARDESGTTKTRPLWGINANPAQSAGQCSTPEAA